MKVLLFALVASCWALPSPKDAKVCDASHCHIEDNCRCASTVNPLSSDELSPQLLAITVSESIVATLFTDYFHPLFFQRRNPDGNPITMTYFVNHEYTDYELVHDLYVQGLEIGVHSITKNSLQEYWRDATFKDLVEEFGGQRQILSTFANIPKRDIVGGRTPQLQLEDDVSISAYIWSGLSYDNSWPTQSTTPLFPYTLNYKSSQECTTSMTCPVEPHPGFWIAPITNIRGADDVECNSLVTCLVQGNATDIALWLMREVDRIRHGNRAPLVLRLDSYWFQFTQNSYEGFTLFLDAVKELDDVFLVSIGEILEWIKNPVPSKDFRTATHHRTSKCNPVTCELPFQGSVRYMRSCVTCPSQYPWKGNPLGNSSAIYN